MKMMRIVIAMAIALTASAAVSCDKPQNEEEVYLEVNAHTLSGKWQLVEWNGNALENGTYVYLDIVRNDRTYTMYQNIDSFMNLPHVVTGSYYIENDPEFGAVIRGNYDHDSGDWVHRYIITGLTATEMYWTAKDDMTYVQKYERVESFVSLQ